MTNICIIGGGIAGLTCAALLRQRHGAEVLVLERASKNGTEDGKSVMFNASSAAVLAEVGAWPEKNAALRQIFVSFGNAPGSATIGDGNVPLGYGASHHTVLQTLTTSLDNSLCLSANVKKLTPENDAVRVDYETPEGEKSVKAQAVVIACAWPGLPTPFQSRVFDYQQAVIALTAKTDNWPPHCAFENFGKNGIVALVPRADANKPVGVIICASEAAAGQLTVLNDNAFMQIINDEFGGRFRLHSPSKRFVYAPQARHVRPLAAARIACLGGGASMLHPAGAQGLNIGIADADCLSSLLAKNSKSSVEDALLNYVRRRSVAHVATLAATSVLAMGGHARFFPFRVAGGLIASTLSAASLPWRHQITRFLSGQKNITTV